MFARTVHVFSDASVGKLGFSGAYIIGEEGPIGIYVEAANSTEAELRTSAAAVLEARARHSHSKLIVHTDLESIDRILVTRRARGAMILLHALEECGDYELRPDGNDHKQHRQCHHHARVMAGIKGTQHPKLTKERKRLKLRPTTREKYVRIIEALHNNPMGTSEVRLSQESGLSLNDTHRILRQLHGHAKVYCEKPDGVDGCDLEKWKWFTRPEFGTLLGEVLKEAGIFTR